MFVESINDTGPRSWRWANEPVGTMASHSGGHSKYKPMPSDHRGSRDQL